MDPFKHIRFVLAPTIFLGSLLLGAWYDGLFLLSDLQRYSTPQITAIAAAIAAATLPVGFAIGSLTVLILNGLWFVSGRKNSFQASVSVAAWKEIGESLGRVPAEGLGRCAERLDRLARAAIFVRVYIEERVEQLLDRRWIAFSTVANGCVALILSWIIGFLVVGIKVDTSYKWLTITGLLFLIFLLVALITWRELMYMLEFIALMPANNRLRPSNERDGSKDQDENQGEG